MSPQELHNPTGGRTQAWFRGADNSDYPLMQTLAELKAEVSLLVQDSRKLLHNVNKLSARPPAV